MKILNLTLKNFRNYDKLDISFNNKLNIIIGNNAQGKTNILEAIYFLSITKSFLPVNEKNVIKRGEVFSSVKCTLDNKKKLFLSLNDNGKNLKLNDLEIKKHSDFVGNIKTIIFSHDDLRIIKDGPINRRKYLNIEISQLYNRYINVLNEFNIVLKQRNEYLKVIKIGNYNRVYFDILTDKFVSLAKEIYGYRNDFIMMINNYIGNIYKEISGCGGLYLKYVTNINLDDDNIANSLRNKLDNCFDREVIYGNTLIGPHRDDFLFRIEDIDLLINGSQGQLKMAIIALKLAEISVFYEVCGENPILLLDDLFSELDIEKRNKVLKYLDRDIQTIITTTDLDSIDDELVKDSYVYKIENGAVIYINYD